MNSRIFLLLGSNRDNPRARLKEAAGKIEGFAGNILARSSVYRTAAWGLEDQPDFFNQVLELSTQNSPEVLLKNLLAVEQAMGRIRKERWGPRVIDIDLLFYGDALRQSPTLQLPHPGIPFRRFTLLPLAEIAPDFVHPVLHKTIATLLEECSDHLAVERVE